MYLNHFRNLWGIKLTDFFLSSEEWIHTVLVFDPVMILKIMLYPVCKLVLKLRYMEGVKNKGWVTCKAPWAVSFSLCTMFEYILRHTPEWMKIRGLLSRKNPRNQKWNSCFQLFYNSGKFIVIFFLYMLFIFSCLSLLKYAFSTSRLYVNSIFPWLIQDKTW